MIDKSLPGNEAPDRIWPFGSIQPNRYLRNFNAFGLNWRDPSWHLASKKQQNGMGDDE
jgi:hypothetical protein